MVKTHHKNCSHYIEPYSANTTCKNLIFIVNTKNYGR